LIAINLLSVLSFVNKSLSPRVLTGSSLAHYALINFAARNLAERDEGFFANSSSDAVTTPFVTISSVPVRSSFLKNCFTNLSSRE
jgi:hypothetical protein